MDREKIPPPPPISAILCLLHIVVFSACSSSILYCSVMVLLIFLTFIYASSASILYYSPFFLTFFISASSASSRSAGVNTFGRGCTAALASVLSLNNSRNKEKTPYRKKRSHMGLDIERRQKLKGEKITLHRHTHT